MSDAPHVSPDARLADGRVPATADDLFRRLDGLGIEVTTTKHEAVFTVEQAKAHRGAIPGGHAKNLFLKDKKGAMWLVVCLEDRKIDLKSLPAMLGSARLSLASPDRLMNFLGVIPGAVTPFAMINDRDGHVRIAFDRGVFEREPLNFHPLDNAMTTSISARDMLAFLEAEGHEPMMIDFPD